MKPSARIALFSALLAVAPIGAARAEGFRCPDGGLVSVGDTKADVRAKCGEPKERKVVTSLPCRKLGRCPVDIEEWLYDFGPTQFVRLLTFDAGRLARIAVRARRGD
jgi:hypothetical protein